MRKELSCPTIPLAPYELISERMVQFLNAEPEPVSRVRIISVLVKPSCKISTAKDFMNIHS
jgi:hypothetical protein